jgi:pimeloyl-ACP methyl ester carboxylesterase
MISLVQIVLIAAMLGAQAGEKKPTPKAQAKRPAQTNTGTAIRPFHAHVPESQVADLRRRALATRWPDKEIVPDQSTGVQLARLQQLVRYWGTGYDWRKVEAKLNSLPQFMTNIDGVDIHFIHVKSRHPKALPMIVTHGWPGSVVEQLKIIAPLTDPTAYGGKAEDAFDVVVPSLPGYGFSSRPAEKGWGPERTARAWDTLMKRLGYDRYVAQGGDWGAVVVESMALQAPAGLLAIHTNLAAAIPPDIEMALGAGAAPAGLSEDERGAFDALAAYRKSGSAAYFVMLTARPQAIGYGLTDSPAGLAAFFLVHPGFAKWTYDSTSPTKDDVLDDFSLYWLTNTAASSARLYWENSGRSPTSAAAWKTTEISVPVAISVFREDAFRPTETWAKRTFPSLIYYHEVEKGGHFAAWEQPQLFTEELRAAFRSLRPPH